MLRSAARSHVMAHIKATSNGRSRMISRKVPTYPKEQECRTACMPSFSRRGSGLSMTAVHRPPHGGLNQVEAIHPLLLHLSPQDGGGGLLVSRMDARFPSPCPDGHGLRHKL
jgi:hypothetical protein